MKNFIIRATPALTLLLMLGAVFGGITFVSAHAATTPAAHMIIIHPVVAKGVKPLLAKVAHPAVKAGAVTSGIYRSSCASGTFNLFADYNSSTNSIGNVDCFTSAGTIDVTIYNVIMVCTGNYTGNVVGYNDGDPYYVRYVLNVKNACYWLRGGPPNYVNVVSHITID